MTERQFRSRKSFFSMSSDLEMQFTSNSSTAADYVSNSSFFPFTSALIFNHTHRIKPLINIAKANESKEL